MKKVYCKKEFLSLKWNRYFYKCKIYYTHEDYTFPNGRKNVFVFLKEDRLFGEGLWFEKDVFDEYFTFDNKFLREEKLNRICNDSIL